MPALAYPDGLRRIRPAHVIRLGDPSRAPTQPIVFVLPPRAELVQMWASYFGGQP